MVITAATDSTSKHRFQHSAVVDLICGCTSNNQETSSNLSSTMKCISILQTQTDIDITAESPQPTSSDNIPLTNAPLTHRSSSAMTQVTHALSTYFFAKQQPRQHSAANVHQQWQQRQEHGEENQVAELQCTHIRERVRIKEQCFITEAVSALSSEQHFFIYSSPNHRALPE